MKYVANIFLLIISLPSVAFACMDIMQFTYAEIAYSGSGMAAVMVVPDGSGDPLTAASTPSGQTVDASITLFLRDCFDVPIASMPQEDMWLESVDHGLLACPGGTVADANTDANGIATWTAPLTAGGYSQTGCRVVISGSALYTPSELPLQFNSPDLNGDGSVNLSDVSVLAGDYLSGYYHFRSDFMRDGILNLSDIAKFAPTLGSSCF